MRVLAHTAYRHFLEWILQGDRLGKGTAVKLALGWIFARQSLRSSSVTLKPLMAVCDGELSLVTQGFH